jgi:phosphonate transport system substrate-binding protein
MVARGAVDPDTIRTIYTSPTFPTTGYGHAHNLHPEVSEKIKEAFFSFNWEGSALQQEFQGEGQFIPIGYKTDWEVIRKIDAANGVSYDCK